MHAKEVFTMKGRTRIVTVLALLGALALAGAASAQDGPGPGLGPPAGGPPGPPGPRGLGAPRGEPGPPHPGAGMGAGMVGLRLPPPDVLERLNLSEAQRAKIDNLLDDERRKAIRADGDIRIAELDLQKLAESDKPDAAAVDEAIARITGLRAELLKARVATLVALRSVLTPDQRNKLRRPPGEPRWH